MSLKEKVENIRTVCERNNDHIKEQCDHYREMINREMGNF